MAKKLFRIPSAKSQLKKMLGPELRPPKLSRMIKTPRLFKMPRKVSFWSVIRQIMKT
ncbi:MAG: hypothetical protein K8S55_13895 [Phycisphaerae bacterium]|nr:hypothetical protein [Phycisphaerae bacterium]